MSGLASRLNRMALMCLLIAFSLSIVSFSLNNTKASAAAPLNVTINQKSGQADPTSTNTVTFTAVFSRAIDPATFTTADIVLTGTAPGKTVDSIVEVAPNDDTTFEINVSATDDGTVIANIPAASTTYSQQLLGATGSVPVDVVLDSSGNMYTIDQVSNTVTKITPAGVSTTHGATGNAPYGITIDGSGNVYTANFSGDSVTKITPAGVVTTFSSVGNGPVRIAVDSSDNVYTANYYDDTVTKITSAGVVSTLGTTGADPWGIAVDSSGNVYTANSSANTVSKITPAGSSSIFATTGNFPYALDFDSTGNLYVVNFSSNYLTKITPAGSATTFGSGLGSSNDIAIDDEGNAYVSCQCTNNGYGLIYKVAADELVTSFLTSALSGTYGVYFDSSSDVLYSANANTNNVSKITPSHTGIKTVDGVWNRASSSTDNTITISGYTGGDTAPVLQSEAASSVTSNSANINGTILSDGGQTITQYGFDFGTSTSYGTRYSYPGSYIGSFQQSVTGLVCGTQYHYRAYAINSIGTGYTTDVTFTTSACPPVPPTVTTDLASGVTTSSVDLHGSVTGQGDSSVTSYGFEYGLSTSYGSSVQTSGSHIGSYTMSLSNLQCGTTYHFRAFANNASGAGYGVDLSFTTTYCPNEPVVLTYPASNIGSSSVQLNGDITSDSGSDITAYGFHYGLDTNYGSTIGGSSPGVGAYSLQANSLACETTYHFRAYASNAVGMGLGADETFTTSACPPVAPTVTTDSYSNGTQTSADIQGTITSQGSSAVTNFGIQYGPDTNYGWQQDQSGSQTGTFTITISGLTCGTLYHFRAYASNNAGPGYGSDQTFTTSACPPPPTEIDLSLEINLATTGQITSGESVVYDFVVTNEGPAATDFDGELYAIAPIGFSFGSTTNPDAQCVDIGLADNSGNLYFIEYFSGHHLFQCEIDVSEPLAVGDSITYEMHGTATSDFVNNETVINAFVISIENEPDFYYNFVTAMMSNIDFRTLEYNNIASHTYSYDAGTETTTTTTIPESQTQTTTTTTQPFAAGTPEDTEVTTTATATTTAPAQSTTSTPGSASSDDPIVEGATETRENDPASDDDWLVLGIYSLTGSNILDLLLIAIFVITIGASIRYIAKNRNLLS